MANVLIERRFISEAERRKLAEHAERLFQQGLLQRNGVGPHRYCLSIRDTPHMTPTIAAIGDRVARALPESNPELDEHLGWVISYIEPGGFVHPHRDNHAQYQVSLVKKHLRCNVAVSKEEDSGNPIIRDVTHTIAQSDMWMFYASDHLHSSQVVRGRARIIYQFGFAVDQVPGLDSSKDKMIAALQRAARRKGA